MGPLQINLSELPCDEDVTFKESSFFTRTNSPRILPPPSQVRAAAVEAKKSGTKRPHAVRFPALNLLVKYGIRERIAEGQCLWAIRHLLADSVPVPEVYGWCRDANETFIYMELIHGDTLEDRWDELGTVEKRDICAQLRCMVDALRQLRQHPAERFIGSIARQQLLDIAFEGYQKPPPGPFPDVKSLHDYFEGLLPWGVHPGAPLPPHPLRPGLCDDQEIVFTHGDLHRSNIIISKSEEGPPRVVAIIDWHQSGWYPAGWEWCKARLTALEGEEWDVEYLPKVLTPWNDYQYHWDYFALALGV